MEEFDGVAGPTDRHRGGGEEIFQNQIPADDPGKELTQGGVSVGIGATRRGDHGGVFGVAEAGKEAAHPRDGEGEDKGGARVLGSGRAGENKDSGSDNGSNPQKNQLPGPQGLHEACLLFGFELEVVDLLGPKKRGEKSHGES